MSPNRDPNTTRRRALKALATAGFAGIAGCTNSDDNGTATSTDGDTTDMPLSQRPTPTTDPPSTATETNSYTGTIQPRRLCGEEETTKPPADPWETIEPTGIPAYHDDPNWRVMGHDTGNTFRNPHANGPESDPTVRWTYECGGNALSNRMVYTPAIVDGTVYAPLLREGGKGALVAIDAETGASERIIETELYLWRLTIVDGIVYVLFGDATAGAFDLETGQRLWKSGTVRAIGSLRRVGDTLIGTKGGVMVGIDADTGEIRWRKCKDTISTDASYAVRADQTVYNMAGNVRRNVSTGAVRTDAPYQLQYPVLDRGQLFGKPSIDTFVSLDWKTMGVNWEFTPDKGYEMGGGYCGIFEEVIMLQTDNQRSENTLLGLDRNTGEVLWRQSGKRLGPMFIATDQNTAYALSMSHAPVALDPKTGEVKWRFETESDVAGAGVALADDLLVVSNGIGKLWALE